MSSEHVRNQARLVVASPGGRHSGSSNCARFTAYGQAIRGDLHSFLVGNSDAQPWVKCCSEVRAHYKWAELPRINHKSDELLGSSEKLVVEGGGQWITRIARLVGQILVFQSEGHETAKALGLLPGHSVFDELRPVI